MAIIFDEGKKRTYQGKTSERHEHDAVHIPQGFQTDPTEDLPRFAQVDHLASLLDRSSKTYLCWSCTILRAKGRGERRGIACASTSLPPLFLSVPSINCPIQRGRLPRRTNCSTEIGTRNNSCIADGRESLWRDPYHRLLPPRLTLDRRLQEDRGETWKTTTQRKIRGIDLCPLIARDTDKVSLWPMSQPPISPKHRLP